MRFRIVLVLLLIAGLLLARSVLFTVDRSEYVYVTQLGRHVATLDGGKDSDAGLHVKWPWPIQSVQRVDRRLLHFDLPGAELLTSDTRRNAIDKTLILDAYVCWRIADADGVDRFLRSVGTIEDAQTILGQRITSELGAAVGRRSVEDLHSTDPARVEAQREQLRDELLHGDPQANDRAVRSLIRVARDVYGIEVVDVRLRRSSHPVAVQRGIFERIRSERRKKAADYRGEGVRLAANIRSQADHEVSALKAKAEAEAIRLRGHADAEADRILNEAQSKDPQFYAFLKKLEAYQRILGDGKTTLLLSTHRELFDVLFQPPRLEPSVPAGAGAMASPARKGGS